MPIAAIVGLVVPLLQQAADLFFDDDDKMSEIADIAAGALKQIPGMVAAIQDIFGGDSSKQLTKADFAALTAKIKGETAKNDQLLADKRAREAQGD